MWITTEVYFKDLNCIKEEAEQVWSHSLRQGQSLSLASVSAFWETNEMFERKHEPGGNFVRFVRMQ